MQSLQANVSAQQAVGLVGHNVAVSGSTLTLGQGGAATGAFDLSAPAKNVSVAIADSTGKAVATLNLGAMGAGSQSFSWNGVGSGGAKLNPGTYSFNVTAVGANSAAVAVTPYAVAPVTGVALGGQSGPMLDLGGLAPVALSAVQRVF